MEPPATDRTKRQTSHEFSKKLIKLTVAGGVAFWVVDFAISLSPISAEYMAAFSISSLPLALVEAFVGGLVIAFCVSFFLLRFFDKIPTKNPILKVLDSQLCCHSRYRSPFNFWQSKQCLCLPFNRHSNEHSKDSRSWNSYWLSIQKAVRISLILLVLNPFVYATRRPHQPFTFFLGLEISGLGKT